MIDDDLPRKPGITRHEVGENLDRLSVEELALRVALLKGEIERLEAAIRAKQASKTAADAFFKP